MQYRLPVLMFAAAAAALSVPAAAKDLKQVKMAEVVRSQFYVPMYVALTNGYVEDEGLDVELVTANGGDRVGALLISGQVDFALSGPEVPIYIRNGESPDKPTIFSALTATDGFFFASREPIEDFDWSMVDGEKVFGWRPGSTPELYLEYVLKEHGLSEDTVAGITTNVGMAARDGAWMSDQWPFGIFTEPSLSKLEAAGELHVLASIGAEIGRADYTVFFAMDDWLAENKDVAQGWTNAIARAQAWMETASKEEIAAAVAPFFPGLSEENNFSVVSRFLENAEPIWSKSTVVSPEGLAKAQEIMVEGGVLPKDDVLAYDAIVDASFAEAAEAEFK
ncbi:ABC transporter substrate-binding protein [Acuticoccus sp. MNP-M23]|uniref:ABC transporter substrate-binding protein n=1 Tax=Acuticoccus sp. MNP-M23 TaxID=3072793 RepID=UPI002815937F|nr:ABC transporter substrate-binding protein [Acuticoccus sp. MNP-M23]WMS41587.1 ABC transporter substrate-binding protein [Acuticoccus sp. MNP-M23]